MYTLCLKKCQTYTTAPSSHLVDLNFINSHGITDRGWRSNKSFILVPLHIYASNKRISNLQTSIRSIDIVCILRPV